MSVLDLIRASLAGRRAWLVGGVVRDQALGRPLPDDVDVVLADDPRDAAGQLARAARRAGHPASCFALSEEFGGWRVVVRDERWQVDLQPLRGGSLEADLRLRDFTVNAIAEPLAGGVRIDPLGGIDDLEGRALRAVSPRAFLDDPLRVLRLARISVELGFSVQEQTTRMARAAAHGLGAVAAERIFTELSKILGAQAAVSGLGLLGQTGAAAEVLPELEALRGVEQSRFHHRDVYGHTMEVLERLIEIERDPGGVLGVDGAQVARLLAEPLADGLTRGLALRWGALMHDVAKPATRAVRPADGRVTFLHHDSRGAEIADVVLRRLRASERLKGHVCALVRHHLRLGFLVHEPQPLARRTVFAYLSATDPVEVDVTLLSVADRLATRGRHAERAIEEHLRMARRMLGDALLWRSEGPPRPLLRGDLLAAELGIVPGPALGELLCALAAAQYAGEVLDAEQALAYARRLIASE